MELKSLCKLGMYKGEGLPSRGQNSPSGGSQVSLPRCSYCPISDKLNLGGHFALSMSDSTAAVFWVQSNMVGVPEVTERSIFREMPICSIQQQAVGHLLVWSGGG